MSDLLSFSQNACLSSPTYLRLEFATPVDAMDMAIALVPGTGAARLRQRVKLRVTPRAAIP